MRVYARHALLLAAIGLVFFTGIRRTDAQVIRAEHDHFTIDEVPAFPIFISYYDALRGDRFWLEDFGFFLGAGIKGLRVMVNGFHQCSQPPTNAVILADGSINELAFQKLTFFLTEAIRRNFLVDLTFVAHPLQIALPQYRHGLQTLASRLKPFSFTNVIINVQNEWDVRVPQFGTSGILSLVEAVHAGHAAGAGQPQRLAAASSGLGGLAGIAQMDFVPFHDQRTSNWFEDQTVANAITGVRNALGGTVKPIFFEEPMPWFNPCAPFQQDSTPGHARAAAIAAKRNGAAAWTFHTGSSFDLANQSLSAQLGPAQRAEIQAAAIDVIHQPWGVSAWFAQKTFGVGAHADRSRIPVVQLGSLAWQATSDKPLWMRPVRSSGFGSVEIDVDENFETAARSAILSVSGRPIKITQPANVHMTLDTPANGAVTGQPFVVGGWAFDIRASSGNGVDLVNVYAYDSAGSPTLLGSAPVGGSRPDVGAVYGSQFANSGFTLTATGLAPGAYTIVAFAHTTVTGGFYATSVAVTVQPAQSSVVMNVDVPAENATVLQSFFIGGWAIDLAHPTASGVSFLHLWATSSTGSVFLGAPTTGGSRPDIGATFGPRFTPSGWGMIAQLPPGQYTIVAYPWSTVLNAFNFNAAFVRHITVQ